MSKKINHLEIVLNKPAATRVYIPGEFIMGVVNLRCIERIRIKCIRLVLFGKAAVQWEARIPSGRFRVKYAYSNKEILVKKEIKLPLNSNATSWDADQYLDEGDFSLPFQLALDENLPTSLEHAHAQIRYMLRAIVDIPSDSNVSAMLSFSVINLLDLNTIKQAFKKPIELSDIKSVGCFPFCSHSCKIIFSVNKCGFVPGERVKFTIEIENTSNVDITDIRVNLIQTIKVFAEGAKMHGQTRHQEKSYTKKMGFVAFPKGSVAAKSEEKWNGTYRIPATCPTYTDSSVIKIEYLFRVSMNIPGSFLTDDELSMSFIIGTIPMLETVPESLVSSFTNVTPASVSDRAQSARGRNMSVISLPNDNFYSLEAGGDKNDLPPPYTFDDTHDNEFDMQSDMNTYRPYYIYYKDFSILK